MKITRVKAHISPEDWQSTLEQLLGETAGEISSQMEDGFLQLSGKWSGGPLRFPYQLQLRVADISPDQLVLDIHLANLRVAPTLVRTWLLNLVVDRLDLVGVDYQNGQLIIDLAQFLLPFPLRFRLAGLSISPAGLDVELEEVTLLPFSSRDLPSAAEEIPEADALVTLSMPDDPEYRAGYDRLRQRIEEWAKRKMPKRLQAVWPWVMLLPDLFAMMVRLLRHPAVRSEVKIKVGAVLTYILLPADLMPDFMPVVGLTDDVLLAFYAVRWLVTEAPLDLIAEVWPGHRQGLEVVDRGLRALEGLLNSQATAYLRRLLNR